MAIYCVLQEAQRLARTKEFRRYRPPLLPALSAVIAALPKAEPLEGPLKDLVDIYRNQLNVDDVRVACRDLGLEPLMSQIVNAFEPHLHRVFNSVLQWRDNGDVKAVAGETTLDVFPSEVPFKDGKLHGSISYDNENFEFFEGYLLPKKINAQVADDHLHDERLHRILVEQMGVEKYLKTSKQAQSWSEKGAKFYFTNCFAMLQIKNKTLRAPTRMHDMAEVMRWYEAKSKES